MCHNISWHIWVSEFKVCNGLLQKFKFVCDLVNIKESYFSGGSTKWFSELSNCQLGLLICCALIWILHGFPNHVIVLNWSRHNIASQKESCLWITKANALTKRVALTCWQKRPGHVKTLGVRQDRTFDDRLLFSSTVSESFAAGHWSH